MLLVAPSSSPAIGRPSHTHQRWHRKCKDVHAVPSEHAATLAGPQPGPSKEQAEDDHHVQQVVAGLQHALGVQALREDAGSTINAQQGLSTQGSQQEGRRAKDMSMPPQPRAMPQPTAQLTGLQGLQARHSKTSAGTAVCPHKSPVPMHADDST